MPRIPEGKFKTEPTSRVGQERPIAIKPNTQRLRQMGQAAQQVGKALERADQRVEALKISSEKETEWNSKEMPVIENLFSMSQGGFIDKGTKLDDGTVIEKRVKLEDAVRERVNKFNVKNMAEASANNPEGGAMYEKYVRGETENMVLKAGKHAKQQVVDDTVEASERKLQLLGERLISGKASVAEAQKVYAQVMDTDLVVGRAINSKMLRRSQMNLAARAHQIITTHPEGLSEAKIAEARALTKILPPAGRELAGRLIDQAIEQRGQMEHTKKESNAGNQRASLTSPTAVAANKKWVDQTTHNNLNAPLSRYETPQGRVSSHSKLEGKVAALEVMGSLGNEPVMMRDALTGTYIENPTYTKAVKERLDRARRDVAGSAMMGFATEEQVMSAVKKEFDSNLAALHKKRSSDPMGFIADFKPSTKMLLDSNNPDAVVPNIITQQSEVGLSSDRMNFASNNEAQLHEGMFESMRNGEDQMGAKYMNFVTNLQKKWGDQAYRAIRDSAAKGGADPSALYVAHPDTDDGFKSALGQSHGRYRKNLAQMMDKEALTLKGGGRLNTIKKGDQALINKVKDVMAEKNLGADSLYFGEGNHARYHGYVNSIKYLAAQKMATDTTLDLDEAMSEAADFVMKHNPSVHDGNSMIMLPKNYLDKHEIDPDDLPRMLGKAKSMSFVREMGYELNVEKFRAFSRGNEVLAGKMEAIAGKNYDKEVQFEDFVKVFEENIVVSPDPMNPENLKFYLRDPATQATTPIPVTFQGGDRTQALSIPANEYYNTVNNASPFDWGNYNDRMDALADDINARHGYGGSRRKK